MNSLRFTSNPPERPMQASKWLKIQVLLDTDEMKSLLDHLGDTLNYLTGAVLPRGKGIVDKSSFLEVYSQYIDSLKTGVIPQEMLYRLHFSSILTVSDDHLFAMAIGEDRYLIRVAKPVVQLQAHSMDYSELDGKFRPMMFGLDSINWGIQFSYPQLYCHPATQDILHVDISPEFPNTALYRKVQKWIRHNTIPTPFLVGGKQINVPMRLGRQCLSWINSHPTLAEKHIRVLRYEP